MNRLELKAWLDDGLSLEQIGAIVGRHPSTVAYWLNKYGLVANGHKKHSPKGGLPKEELAVLVRQGHTLAVIAEKFDVSIRTVRYWIERFDLPSPRSRRRAAVAKAIEEGRRTRCRRCRSERVSEWRRRTKAKLVEEAGGSCRICGYDRSLAALEFHHVNPAEKSFALSLRGVTRSIEVLREEAKKCVLLCANCHAAVEAGHLTL